MTDHSAAPTTHTLALKIYPIVVGIMAIAIAILMALQLGGGRGSTRTDGELDPERLGSEIPITPPERAVNVNQPLALPDVDPAIAATSNLRISNQTPYPLRVVLRSRQVDPTTGAIANFSAQDLNQVRYATPVHWDFAPEEGSQSGLLVSLPEQPLTLQTGDVLMAFTQDGSQLYWGPYIVGASNANLQWYDSSQEWQLILTTASP